MPTYTYLLFRSDGSANSLNAVVLDHDEATFVRVGQHLDDWMSCDVGGLGGRSRRRGSSPGATDHPSRQRAGFL